MKSGLTQGLRRAAQMRGAEVALIDGARRFLWAEIKSRIDRLAGALQMLGIGADDRVALLALNSHRSFETYFAALTAGGVLTAFNHRLSQAEIVAQVGDAEPKVLIVGPEFVGVAHALRAAVPSLEHVILCGDDDLPAGLLGYEALIDRAQAIADAGRGGDDMAFIFYTGGTTGAAKGVMLSHANIIANSINFITHLGIDERTVHLHCGPLFHVAAGVRLFSVTMAGGTHVMLPRFVAREVLDTIAETGVTLATFVPTMLRTLLDEPAMASCDLSSLDTITYGAAPMPEAMLREVMERLPAVRFIQSYGMTETSPIITMLGWRDHLPEAAALGRLRSAGRAALFAEVAIVDLHDRPVPPGERGEVVARGPMVMLGYWRNAAATADALRGGWMHTGDIGFLDERGYLYIVDRLKDVIISGGENVYSQEVESAIMQHKAVQQCAVFGLPDARWGEVVHAAVVPRTGMNIAERELIDHCKGLIASFKCPRSVEIRTQTLPLSGANKILKNELRAEMLRRLAIAGDRP